MDTKSRHGVAWFDVLGQGIVKRDFMVDIPELLEEPTKSLVDEVLYQIIVLDNSLPNELIHCRPVNIDIMVGQTRRIFRYADFTTLLEQKL